jgi:hypothetical protein
VLGGRYIDQVLADTTQGKIRFILKLRVESLWQWCLKRGSAKLEIDAGLQSISKVGAGQWPAIIASEPIAPTHPAKLAGENRRASHGRCVSRMTSDVPEWSIECFPGASGELLSSIDLASSAGYCSPGRARESDVVVSIVTFRYWVRSAGMNFGC